MRFSIIAFVVCVVASAEATPYPPSCEIVEVVTFAEDGSCQRLGTFNVMLSKSPMPSFLVKCTGEARVSEPAPGVPSFVETWPLTAREVAEAATMWDGDRQISVGAFSASDRKCDGHPVIYFSGPIPGKGEYHDLSIGATRVASYGYNGRATCDCFEGMNGIDDSDADAGGCRIGASPSLSWLALCCLGLLRLRATKRR